MIRQGLLPPIQSGSLLPGTALTISFEPLDLHLARPFTIARGTQLQATNVLVRLEDHHLEAIGEAAPSEHYGDTQASSIAFLNHAVDSLDAMLPMTVIHQRLEEIARSNPAPKAAIDMAAFDLLGKRLNAPLYQILGLDPAATPQTSFTIGIDSPEVMAQKAKAASAFPILKVKVGTPRDLENLEAIRSVSTATIRVDANEAWTPKQAVAAIRRLAPFDLEFVEQPVPAGNLAGLKFVRDNSPVPIIADEACILPSDVARVASHCDGINIKLMKCGGLWPALQMIHTARGLNLSVMMGCMIESSLAITAAAHLSPLLDYADLDGNLLIRDDPFLGVAVDNGKLVLPNRPGLGVEPRTK